MKFFIFSVFGILFPFTVSAQFQTQLGSDIIGEAFYDESGWSVSLSSDGSTVAIGARDNDGNGDRAGHVRVYKNINGTWTQQGSDIDGEAARDQSGESISLSGDGSTVAIGAARNDDNGSMAGHVRVYKNISGTWTQQGSDIDGEAAYDQFGKSVSLSSDGSTVAIGAYLNDTPDSVSGIGLTNAGHVRVYKNISGTWTQQGSDIDGKAAGDWSGYSVSLSSDGSTVAIGAPEAAYVRVYRNINGTWTQQGSDIDSKAAGDNSGWSVSLSSDGSTVAIGASRNLNINGKLQNAGLVRVYKNISGTWTQQGSDIDGEAASDQFGYSVSLSSDGSTVAIGTPYNDGNGLSAGHVRVYKNISGTWTQQGSDIDGDLIAASGWSVSLSSDGSIVAIGARAWGSTTATTGHSSEEGNVRIYEVKDYKMHEPKFMHGNLLSSSDTAYSCTGLDTIIVDFNIEGTFPVGTQFNYELSDETGSFAKPILSGTKSNIYFNDTLSIPVTSLIKGHYLFRIKNNLNNRGQWYESSNVLTILKRPNNPIIMGDSLVENYCDQQIISAKLPIGTNKLEWTYDGSILEGNIVDTITSITVSNDGIYTLREYNQACEADTSLNFFKIKPSNQPLCMVTIDSSSGGVQILWEKNDTFATAFKVYRETSQTGNYERLKSQQYSDFSLYIDTMADPLIQSYTYRLITDNVCEDSAVSLAHSTIHLSSNVGVNGEHNLYWTNYIGFPVSTYKIYNNNGGGFKKIAEVAGNKNTYSVIKPASGSNIYLISVEHPTGCKPSKRTERSISNSVMIGTAGMNEVKKYLASVYPNPVSRSLNVKCNALLIGLPYIIVSTKGKEIYSGFLTHQTTNIDIQDLPLGMYFLKIGNGINQAYRFIKN